MKATEDYEQDLKSCKKEYDRCEGDLLKEIKFTDKYGGDAPGAAIYNCSRAKNPEVFKKMVEACGKATVSPKGPWPIKKP